MSPREQKAAPSRGGGVSQGGAQPSAGWCPDEVDGNAVRAGAKLCAAAVGWIADGFPALTGREPSSTACGLKPRHAVRLTVFPSTRGRTPVPVPADRKDAAAIRPLSRAHGVRLRRGQRGADGAARGPRRAVHQSCGTQGSFKNTRLPHKDIRKERPFGRSFARQVVQACCSCLNYYITLALASL